MSDLENKRQRRIYSKYLYPSEVIEGPDRALSGLRWADLAESMFLSVPIVRWPEMILLLITTPKKCQGRPQKSVTFDTTNQSLLPASYPSELCELFSYLNRQ